MQEYIDKHTTDCYILRNVHGYARQYHCLKSKTGRPIRVELLPQRFAIGRSYGFIIEKGTTLKIYTSTGLLLTECAATDLSCYEFIVNDAGEWECECNEVAPAAAELPDGAVEVLRF
jgi:hypothetical protein